MILALEAISEADGAAGWTLMIGVETVGIAMAALAPPVAEAMLGDRPDVVFSGAINPLGQARRVDGGYIVNGRWPYASGCQGADYFWGGCILVDDDGEPARSPQGYRMARQVVVPRDAVLGARDVGGGRSVRIGVARCRGGRRLRPRRLRDGHLRHGHARPHPAVPAADLQPPGLQQDRRRHRRGPHGHRRLRRLGQREDAVHHEGAAAGAPAGPAGHGRGRGAAAGGAGLRAGGGGRDVGGDVRGRGRDADATRRCCGWRARTAASRRYTPSSSSTRRPGSPPASRRRRWSEPSATCGSCPSTPWWRRPPSARRAVCCWASSPTPRSSDCAQPASGSRARRASR